MLGTCSHIFLNFKFWETTPWTVPTKTSNELPESLMFCLRLMLIALFIHTLTLSVMTYLSELWVLVRNISHLSFLSPICKGKLKLRRKRSPISRKQYRKKGSYVLWHISGKWVWSVSCVLNKFLVLIISSVSASVSLKSFNLAVHHQNNLRKEFGKKMECCNNASSF